MVQHNYQCSKCSHIATFPVGNIYCCGRLMEILWSTNHKGVAAAHEKERTVVYEHPVTGEVAYPGRNDVQMPSRYRDRGFLKKDFNSIYDLQRFEKTHHVLNEAVWFDKGSGRDFD